MKTVVIFLLGLATGVLGMWGAIAMAKSMKAGPQMVCLDELSQGENHAVFIVRSGPTPHDSEWLYSSQQGVYVIVYKDSETAKIAAEVLRGRFGLLRNLPDVLK
jgi:hypothetical protein